MTALFLLDTDLFEDEGLFRAAFSQLSEARQEKIARFRFAKDKRLSLGAGVLLDLALRGANLRERDAAMAFSAHGKPEIKDRPELHFNLSHSAHYAACALSGGPVGVDLEQIGRVSDALIRRVCAEGEASRLLGLDEDGRAGQFIRLWTMKESFLKRMGAGLSLPLERLETDFGPPPSIRLDGEGQAVSLWQKELGGCWLTVCTGEGETVRLEEPAKAELYRQYGLGFP